MNLYNLRNFTVIARESSISNAARKLNISQPALSKMMRQMETELGFYIFDRSAKGTVLNENGRKYLEMVEKILGEYDQCTASLRELNGETARNINISFNSCGKYVPIITVMFKKIHPDAWFELRSYERGKHDADTNFFLYARERYIEPDEFTDYLGREELFLTAGEGSPYDGLSSVSLSELSSRSFLTAEPPNDMYEIQRYYCERAGFSPLMDNLVEKQNVLLGLLKLGIGVSLEPKVSDVGLVQIPIEGGDCYRYLYLRRNANAYQTKYAREFRSLVIDYFKKTLKN